jgi:hypothetical protein
MNINLLLIQKVREDLVEVSNLVALLLMLGDMLVEALSIDYCLDGVLHI